jgi:hypothetical protein
MRLSFFCPFIFLSTFPFVGGTDALGNPWSFRILVAAENRIVFFQCLIRGYFLTLISICATCTR